MLENVRLSFQGIWSHKMRSFLTMLGIIIGIASIISIVSTIKGTNEQIKQNLIGAGNNNVTVSLKQGDGDYWMDNGLPSGVSKLSDDQKKRIRESAHVLDTKVFHISSFHFFHHCQKSGTVKASTTDTVISKMDCVRKALMVSIFFKQLLLVRYAVALALLVIVSAQSLIKSSDFFVSSHGLRSFLRF